VIDMSDQNNKKDADARSMYEINVEDIRWAKGRIWTSTYYILSLYAGFIALSRTKFFSSNNSDSGIKLYILVLSTIITMVGIYHLIETHAKLVQYRNRLEKLINIFHQDVRKIITIEEKYPDFKRYFISLILPFIIQIIVGHIFVYFSLYEFNCDYFKLILTLAFIIIFGVCIFCYFKDWKNKEEPLNSTLIWLTVVKRKNSACPTVVSSGSLS
jgi:hypothetical protein